MKINLFGSAPPPPPFGKKPTVAQLKKILTPAAQLLPNVFRDGYALPLQKNLTAVLAQLGSDLTSIESITGAVYQQAQKIGKPQLQRFSAVISDLYRSFLSKKRRTAADFPIVETIPPLAMFQNKGDNGPFTIPSDDIENLFGAAVGVVSMPAVYRDHPVLWTALSHETGGHDVIHADVNLMPEMRLGVRQALGGPTAITSPANLTQKQIIALLWDYWMDEAAADIYGVMNVGPTFGHNLAVFFSALNAQAQKSNTPSLRTQSGFDPNDPQKLLDPHPTDLLRLSLIRGAVETLTGLAKASITGYSTDFNALAQICAPGATKIDIAGNVLLGPGQRVPVQASFPLADMQDAAFKAGQFIATAKFNALSGHSIQEIETWNDLDEQTAQSIAAAMKNKSPVTGLGDDAQLLAGANIAILADPALYAPATQFLNAALDESFANDPFWSKPKPDPAFFRELSMDLHPPQRARKAKA
ncbi:MAG: hypothetical protein HY232_16965 [Acidobacteria bacterium]|nr:hypothetical protein [Acidobacteriota bacterium]